MPRKTRTPFTLEERKLIQEFIAEKRSKVKDVAAKLSRPVASIYAELNRFNSWDKYDAEEAHVACIKNAQAKRDSVLFAIGRTEVMLGKLNDRVGVIIQVIDEMRAETNCVRSERLQENARQKGTNHA